MGQSGFTQWRKSKKGQQTIVILAFIIIPLILLFTFTYLPFAEMVKFSFYKMKYVGTRKFVGLDNYRAIFKRDDILGALKLCLYYMAGSIIQLVIIIIAKFLQDAFFKYIFRNASADDEAYDAKKRKKKAAKLAASTKGGN